LVKKTHLIYDVMQYTEEKDLPALLLWIDFEKVFEIISWNFIIEIVKYFNSGESVEKRIHTFQNNTFSSII